MRHFVTWPRTDRGSALRWADRGGDIVLAAIGSHPVWWRCWLCWVVRWWIWRWRWFWWWWHCSGDSRYKPRHHHERNCDVTKKVLRTIFNSRHAREKLPRRLLGQPGFWRPPFEIIHLQSEKSNNLNTYHIIQHPPRPFSRGQTVLYKGFQRQSETSGRERRSSWCLRCRET